MPKKMLISTIGSRGEVQPVIALASELRALGHQAVLCVPPTFKEWVESFGIPFVPLGPDVKMFVAASSQPKRKKPSQDMMRKLVRDSVVEQFAVTTAAAKECDLILTAGDLQHAGKSIAESMRIPHVHATYCPVTLRSTENTPPNLSRWVRSQRWPGLVKRALWRLSDMRWNALYRDVLNEQRAELGLSPIHQVPSYIANQKSLIAADSLLAPAPTMDGAKLFQTGAWLLHDRRPLPDDLESFLAAGDPPIYFGFGSMGAKQQTSRLLIEAARALGYRALISQGWGNLAVTDSGDDCFAAGDVSHEKLFPRVAAIVHHGGAGTTTAAARSGKPQVIVPHLYDQHYWAHRVQQLGIGVSAGLVEKLSSERLVDALRKSLRPERVERAKAVATRIESHGATVAAERLSEMARFSSAP